MRKARSRPVRGLIHEYTPRRINKREGEHVPGEEKEEYAMAYYYIGSMERRGRPEAESRYREVYGKSLPELKGD